MRYIFSTSLLLCFFQLCGQTGNYFLSHYSPQADRLSNVCFDIVQDEQGIFYFATRNGILEFDGRNWDVIPSNGAIYSLQRSNQQLYWGGVSGYGTVNKNREGSQEIRHLSPEGVGDVFECIVVKNHPYFLTEQKLFIHNQDAPPTEIKANDQTGSFTGIFKLFESVYLNTERGGVYKVDGTGNLIAATLGIPAGEEVIFSSELNNLYLIGLSNNKIFLCGENLKLRPIALEDQAYVDASVVVNGSWINRDLFALGTLRGGLIFIQTATGKTQEITNYGTGLPDNEVYALMTDKGQNIWAAHEYGFTRIAPYLPFRSFSHYPGLNGNLLCAHTFQKRVYVGTSLGLYYLEKEELYDEITYYVEVEIPANTDSKKTKQNTQVTKPQETTPVVTPVEESKKRGLLRFLKRNRNKEPEGKINEPAPAVDKSGATTETAAQQPRYKRLKKTEKVLRASQFVFKKVNGIDAKVTQLIEFDGKLIAVGLGGAYQVSDHASVPILEEPVRRAYASKAIGALLISTYQDDLHTYRRQSDKWISADLLPNFHDQISFIQDGSPDEVWLFALDKAYRLELDKTEVKNITTAEITNPGFDDIVSLWLDNKMIIANTEGFFGYETTKNQFVPIDTLPRPVQYAASEGSILFKDAHSWNILGSVEIQSNLQLLNLSRNLRFIAVESNSENLWIITANNELFRFFGEMFTPYDAGYPLMLRSIHSGGEKVDSENLEIDETKKSISFEVTRPDYLAAEAIEYRYQLKGMNNSWSEWSTQHNVIDFPYLPAGDYTLLFQARDVLGKTSELSPVSFEVLPPYWKRPWFYALEFFVFAALVLLSFRLSTRYRIISRVLSLLTIIMLIQFIQTVISETFGTRASPVTDFFMQVSVAFLILPVEGYLRNLMLRSLDSNSGLYRFLTPKRNPVPAEKQEE